MKINKRKTTKTLTMIAVFTALGYVLTFIKIPMPAPIAFLDLDFSNVMTMLCGFSLGPVSMLISEAIKQLLCFFTNSTTGGVGQIADFLMAMGYGIIPSVMYYFKRTRKTVFIGLPIGCVGQIVVSLLSNRFITFPLYMGEGAAAAFEAVWPYLIAFNAGKAVIISVITFLVYKSLSRALKKIFGEDKQLVAEKKTEQTVKTYLSDSEEKTRELAFELAKTMSGGEVITLSGDLGAGKTVFAKGFALGLGITDEVTSPTFTVMNEYEGEKFNLYHYDAYRLQSGREAYEAGLCDYLGDKNSVCLIEWADNMKSVLPENIVKIEIIYVGETEREIKIYE